jgi:hypothetical protein
MWIAKRHAEAAAGFAELLSDIVASLNDESSLAASARLSIARALVDDGRPQEALPYAERAQRQFTALYGADEGRTINASNTLQRIRRSLSLNSGE